MTTTTAMRDTHQILKNNQQRMRSIEGARGLAALMVVLMHAANLMAVEHFSGHVGLNSIFAFGYVGVDFFFTLSGFIIAFIHFDDIGRPIQLGTYLRKRMARIYPIFWICLVLAVSVLIVGRIFLGKDTPLGFSIEDIAGTIFLFPSSTPKFVEVAWSLQYEVMFYAAFALLIASRRLGIVIFLAWLLAILWRLMFAPDSASYAGLLSAYSLQFMFGVATGVITRKCDSPWAGKSLLALGIGCFIAAIYYERSIATTLHGPMGQVLLGLCASLILLCLVELEKKNSIHTPGIMYTLGSVSYSIYLSHIVFLNLVYSVLLKAGLYHHLPEAVVYFVAVMVALICSSLIGLLIELPVAKFLKRKTSPVQPALKPASLIHY